LVAEMDGVAPEVKRTHMNDATLVEPSSRLALQNISGDNFDYTHLKIPRKPAWTREMTAEQVDRRETEAFLQWRREIAQMEQSNPAMRVTPFEKNIEVWRQLWRVLERCDLAMQVVDARNPLLYYTADLVQYAAEQSPPRPVMLLVNKADLLTEHQRKAWARHFAAIGVRFAFYSAHDEQDKCVRMCRFPNQHASALTPGVPPPPTHLHRIDALSSSGASTAGAPSLAEADEDVLRLVEDMATEMRSGGAAAAVPASSSSASQASVVAEFVWGDAGATTTTAAAVAPVASGGHLSTMEDAERVDRMARVLTRQELILLLTALPARLGLSPQERHASRICVGMLGYPNGTTTLPANLTCSMV